MAGIKRIKDMSQEEIEDEVCDRLIQIDNEDDFITCVMVMLMTHKESIKMMLMYLRDKGAIVTRQEAVNAACNIYHFMNGEKEIYPNDYKRKVYKSCKSALGKI